MSAGLKSARVAPAAACDFVSIVVALAADRVVFHQMPNALSLAGSGVIVAASLIPILFASRAGGHGVPRAKSGGVGSAAEEPAVQLATESSQWPAGGGGGMSRRHDGGAGGRDPEAAPPSKGAAEEAALPLPLPSPASSPWRALPPPSFSQQGTPLRHLGSGGWAELPSPVSAAAVADSGNGCSSGGLWGAVAAGEAPGDGSPLPSPAALERTASGLSAQLRAQGALSPRLPAALVSLGSSSQRDWGKTA